MSLPSGIESLSFLLLTYPSSMLMHTTTAPSVTSFDEIFESCPEIADVDVHEWATILRTYPIQLLRRCDLAFLEHRKNKHGAEHEFLDLTFVCRGIHKSYIRYLQVHRHPSLKPIPLHVQLGGGITARDTISVSRSPFDTTHSYPLYQLRFPPLAYPTILDLAAMLVTVISLAPRYHLYTSACYWFARMVFEGLKHVFHGEVLKGEKAHNRGKYAGIILLVDENTYFLWGKPRALRRWQRFQSALAHKRMEAKALHLHKLIDYLYYARRHAMYPDVYGKESCSCSRSSSSSCCRSCYESY